MELLKDFIIYFGCYVFSLYTVGFIMDLIKEICTKCIK